MTPRGLGHRPDPPDARDHILATHTMAAPVRKAGNVARLIVSVLDQEQLGSCVIQSLAQNIRCAHVRAGIAAPLLLSRLLAYFASRAATGDTAEDTGTEVRTACKQLAKIGFCPEKVYPYDIAKFANAPPQEVWREAFDQSAAVAGTKLHFARIAATGGALVTALRQAIDAELPISFGAPVSNRFCQNDIDTPMQKPPSNDIAGGHSQLIIGYQTASDGSVWFQVLNSWGADEFGLEINGVKGCTWWHQDYITWVETTDFWTVDSAPQFSSEAA